MIKVSDINARLNYVLNDEESIRWTLEERVAWINDAAKEIVIIRPAAGGITDTVELQAGVRQEIPDGGTYLMDVIRNIKADDKPGRPVKRADRRLLDEQNPDWYAKKEQSEVKHYTYDDRAPRTFYTYPPVKAGTKVELLYAAPPDEVTPFLQSELDMDASYIGPIVSYVLYRALAKDSEYANGAVAAAHLSAFQQAMGVKNEVSLTTGPRGPYNEAP